jgi:hypothetical protein
MKLDEIFVRESWKFTWDRNVFKFYKMQLKFENHEIRRERMASYVKLVINHIECFEQVVKDDVWNWSISLEVLESWEPLNSVCSPSKIENWIFIQSFYLGNIQLILSHFNLW